MWQVWRSGVPQHLCRDRRANCRVNYLLPPLHGFQGLNWSCRACQARDFMRWAISPVSIEVFKTQIIRMLGGAMAQQKRFVPFVQTATDFGIGGEGVGPEKTRNTRKRHFIEGSKFCGFTNITICFPWVAGLGVYMHQTILNSIQVWSYKQTIFLEYNIYAMK